VGALTAGRPEQPTEGRFIARAPDSAAYTPVPGIPPLRQAIADELSRDYAGAVELRRPPTRSVGSPRW
jgi:aspartate/methionine/tyrosine aminotransferase